MRSLLLFRLRNALSFLRTYEKEKLYLNDKASNVSKDLAFTHMAVFNTFYDWGNFGVRDRDFVASCITLMPPTTVPAGNKYNVTLIYLCKKTCNHFILINISAWYVFKCKWCNGSISICAQC